MYIESPILREVWAEQLRELEEELDAPIRIIGGVGQRGPIHAAWTAAHCDGYESDVARERGLTVVTWRSFTTNSPYVTRETLPEVLWIRSNPLESAGDGDVYIPPMWDQFAVGGHPLEDVGVGALVIHDEVLGEIVPRHVYHYLNLVEVPHRADLDFDLLIGNPLRLAASDDLVERNRATQHERARQALAEWSVGAADRALHTMRQNINDYEESLATQISNLANTRRTLREYGLQARALEAAAEDERDAEAWVNQYDALTAHPRITDVTFNNGSLSVTTDMMTMTHPLERDLTRTLGRMKVTFRLTPSSIVIANLDFPRAGRPHPHVESGGRPCFGNIEETVYQYMNDGRFDAAMEVLIAFFQTANERDDWGRYMRMWFGVPDALDTPPEDGAVMVGDLEALEADLEAALNEIPTLNGIRTVVTAPRFDTDEY
jgi:hypothetical protein